MIIQVVGTNCNFRSEEHPSATAWRNSRPDNAPIPTNDILKLDLPVNEIPMVTLFIESTILEREIIVSPRNHVMWAQTSRVQDILKFTYPDSLPEEVRRLFERQRNKMEKAKEAGVRQDSYRKHLPLLSNTKYTINISMRDLINIYLCFSEIGHEHSHLRSIFFDSCGEILSVLHKVFDINKTHIDKYKGKPILKSLTRPPQSGLIGDTLVVTTTLPLSLRAQLARHRALSIIDNLPTLLRDKYVLFENNEFPVQVQISGSIEDWTEIIRKRSCWIAQYDLWSPLLNEAEKHLQIGDSSLPCHNGACPYDGDAIARYTDEDPNAPCPKHALLSGRTISAEQMLEVVDQKEQDLRPQFWNESISELSKNSNL